MQSNFQSSGSHSGCFTGIADSIFVPHCSALCLTDSLLNKLNCLTLTRESLSRQKT